jgi:hypothetical protein
VGNSPRPFCVEKRRFYRVLVGAVGIELKVRLKTRNLFILLEHKNDKNPESAQPRYTRGTQSVVLPSKVDNQDLGI